MSFDWPLGVMVGTLWAYWLTVLGLAANKRLRTGQSAGLWPRKAKERRLWLLVGPTILAWIGLPTLALLSTPEWLAVPAWVQGPLGLVLRGTAAATAVAFFLLSVRCWREMGQSWSMAIVPGQKTKLVTSGIYAWVRHPIYALSIGLMVCTLAVLPVLPIFILAAFHFIAFNRKAAFEEQHLMKEFGPDYQAYCRRVGRFWPGRKGVTIESKQVQAK